MTQATIHEAKTHLSKLIRKALDGEEVIIAKRDKPLVRLQVIPPAETKRQLGWAKGLVTYMAPDFDAEPEEFEEYMYTPGEIAQRRAQKKKNK
ncbi:MAG TPA: type II toxin-antitoxin system prevent-host-death family antitoxin [Chthoniobacterales bacterium]|jgi:prevent-host-death family protein